MAADLPVTAAQAGCPRTEQVVPAPVPSTD